MKERVVRKTFPQKPQIDTILDKKMWVIVDNSLRPVCHKDGFILIFHRKRDAQDWLFENELKKNPDSFWRIKPLKVTVEEI